MQKEVLYLSFGEKSKQILWRTKKQQYREIKEETYKIEFNSQVELNAFLDGVKAAIGWHEYVIIDEGTYNEIHQTEPMN